VATSEAISGIEDRLRDEDSQVQQAAVSVLIELAKFGKVIYHVMAHTTNCTPDDIRAKVVTPGVISAILARLGDAGWSVQALVELAKFGKAVPWVIISTNSLHNR